MKQMMIVLCLFVVVPVVAMEKQIIQKKEKLESYLFLVTSEENQKFAEELVRRLSFCRTVTADSKYVSQDNPIYKVIERLSQEFKECNNDVLELITSKGLVDRISEYEKKCNDNTVASFCLTQIHRKEGDVAKARLFVSQSREIYAEMRLKKLRLYYCQSLGADQIQDKIDYMNKNKGYPTNEEAIKDFMALFIYRVIFAHQTHKK